MTSSPNNEIKMRVSVQDDATRQLQEVANAEKAVAQQAADSAKVMKDAAAATDQRKVATKSLQERIAELTAEQDRFIESVRAGAKVDDQAIEAAERRQREISRLSSALERQTSTEAAATQQAKEAAAATNKAAEAAQNKTGAFGRLAAATESFRGSMLALVAAGAGTLQLLRDLVDRAKEYADAVARVGEATRSLSANIGGKDATTVYKGITAIAAASGFNVQGRAQLLESVSTLTDVETDLAPDQILRSAGNLALFQRTTGVGGKEGYQTLQAIRSNLNVSEDAAVDKAVTLVNSGFAPQAIQDVLERSSTAPGGGEEVLAAMLAARKFGLDPEKAGRAVPSLIDNLTKTGDDGGLAPELQAAGVRENQTLLQRMEAVIAAGQSGQITRGQAESLLGGAAGSRLWMPLSRARAAGADRQAMAELQDANAAEKQLDAILMNPAVRVQERANLRELRVQVEKEAGTKVAQAGEVAAQLEAETANMPWYLAIPYTAKRVRQDDLAAGGAVYQNNQNVFAIQDWMGQGQATPGGGQAGPTIINNITNQYNAGDSRLTAPTGRLD